jgi:hypothetical protein
MEQERKRSAGPGAGFLVAVLAGETAWLGALLYGALLLTG